MRYAVLDNCTKFTVNLVVTQGVVELTYDRERLITLLKQNSLRTGTFKLVSGRFSHYYVDGRRVTLLAEGAGLIGAAMVDLIVKRPEVTAIGGLTLGADPIVGATLAVACAGGFSNLGGFLVRKESKTHGTGRLLEGVLEPGMTAIVVDDVATTGGSALQAVDAVLAVGAKVSCVVAVLDRLEGAAEACAARGVEFVSLLTIRDLGVEPLQC